VASSLVSWRSIRGGLKRIKPLRAVVRTLRERIEHRSERAWILEGKELSSQQPLSVLFAGKADSKSYIAQLVFGESWIEKEQSRIWKGKLLQRARAGNGRYDLAIVQSDLPQPATDVAAAIFQVPCWVGGGKNLAAAREFARHSKQIKIDIKRIKKNRLDYRVTSEPEEFERFYHSMYLPHVRRVFQDGACLTLYEEIQAAMPSSELFLVTRDGQDIAGGILTYDGNGQVHVSSVGVKDGDVRWVKAGALAGYDYLRVVYLLEKGIRRLHLGASRPFLNNGALCFKKKRGMDITDCTRQSFIILPQRGSAGMTGFLRHNPFIYQDEGKLKGAIFVSEDTLSDIDAARLFHDWYVPGLDSLTLFFNDEGPARDLSFRMCGWIDSSGVLNAGSQ
jgi:hypothetical protein